MAIENIENTLAAAVKEMVTTYGFDAQRSLFLLQEAVADVYGSHLPAKIWEDGRVSVLTDVGQLTYNLSKDKLSKIKRSLSHNIAYQINRDNAERFRFAALRNGDLFFMRIDESDGRHTTGRIYRYLDKDDKRVVMNGAVGHIRISDKTVFKKDRERQIFSKGNNILVAVSSISDNDDGTIRVNFVRRDRRVIDYVVQDAFGGLASIDQVFKYKHWFNFKNKNDVVSIAYEGEMEKMYRNYLSLQLRKRLNCNVRLIEKGEEL